MASLRHFKFLALQVYGTQIDVTQQFVYVLLNSSETVS
jgi:hypothetical protein